ncbi:MAG: hypothetical protein AAFY48_10310 [Bacteroidota bacterium]
MRFGPLYLILFSLVLTLLQCSTDDPSSAAPKLLSVKTLRLTADPTLIAVPPMDSLQQYFIEDYDSLGQIIKVTYYTASGVAQAIFENVYQNGLKTANTFMGGDGTVYSKNQFFYDTEGREIASKTFNSKEEQTGEQRRRYRSGGREKDAIALDSTGVEWRYATYYYDEQDREVRLDEYNGENQLIAIVTSDYKKTDERGQWLECYKYVNDTLRTVELREYKYTEQE